MRKIIDQFPIVAILRNVPDSLLEKYVRSLYNGGIRSFEVSFTTPNAVSQLAWMKQYLPDDCYVGAGTILNPENAKKAVDAGADYLLSPSTDEPVLAYCQKNNIRLLPGVFSPSDVSLCLSYGFKTLKLFPAGDLPMCYIKSLKGPFPDADFVAVGGVSPENTPDYLNQGYIGVGIGGSLIKKEWLAQEAWHEIETHIQTFINSMKEKNIIVSEN